MSVGLRNEVTSSCELEITSSLVYTFYTILSPWYKMSFTSKWGNNTCRVGVGICHSGAFADQFCRIDSSDSYPARMWYFLIWGEVSSSKRWLPVVACRFIISPTVHYASHQKPRDQDSSVSSQRSFITAAVADVPKSPISSNLVWRNPLLSIQWKFIQGRRPPIRCIEYFLIPTISSLIFLICLSNNIALTSW